MDYFKNKKILIIGDIMLDSYTYGNVYRVSPEAPVPILNLTKQDYKLGGSGNVALNIKALGGTPILISCVGDDNNGKIIISKLKESNISSKFILKSNNRITTDKLRFISNNHQLLRVDTEIVKNLDDCDNEKILSYLFKVINNEKIDCILIQDYDKGLLSNSLIDHIIDIANNRKIKIIVDPKHKNFNFYKNISLFKPNLKEFKEGLNLTESDDNYLSLGSSILHNRGIEIVFVTLAEKGIFLSYKLHGQYINKIIPTIPRNIIDVSGAGDTCISIISLILGDLNIEEIANIVNIAGGLVCEEIGVVPINKEKLIIEINKIK